MIEPKRTVIVVALACAWAFAAAAACDDSADGDGDGDADADADADADLTTDADCPVNSGYPCGCDGTQPRCDDESDCLAARGADHGFCSKTCLGAEDDVSCHMTDWGVQPYGGACVVVTNPTNPNVSDHCAILCEYDGGAAPCPPDVVCTAVQGGRICQ